MSGFHDSWLRLKIQGIGAIQNIAPIAMIRTCTAEVPVLKINLEVLILKVWGGGTFVS